MKQDSKIFFAEPVEAVVEKLISNSQGLVRVGGEAVLVAGSLAGERLKIAVGEPKNGVRRGRILEIIEPSAHRIEPDCLLAGHCGGCDFIHVAPEAALKLKAEAALSDAAAGWGLELALIESPARARYRTRATLHLALREGGQPGLGFYNEKRALIEFDDCLLIHPKLMDLTRALRSWARALPVGAATGAEFMLTLGEGESGAFIAVNPPPAVFKAGRRTESPSTPPALIKALPSLAESLAARFPNAGLFVRPAPRAPLHPITKQAPKRLPSLTWPEWDLQLSTGPGEFTQVNPEVNKSMVRLIVEHAAPLAKGRALDLYSGHGNIALPLARAGFAVTAVEESPEAAQSARANAQGRIDIKRGQCEKIVAQLKREGQKFDLIVLDPPRAGANDLAPALAALQPQAIIYVACHPAVLTRDIPAFLSLGFTPKFLTALDMFPRTSHLESLLLLRR